MKTGNKPIIMLLSTKKNSPYLPEKLGSNLPMYKCPLLVTTTYYISSSESLVKSMIIGPKSMESSVRSMVTGTVATHV